MRSKTLLLAGLSWFGLACDSPSSGSVAIGQPLVAASAPTEDPSVLGNHFQFLRPPPNLLIKRGEKRAGETEAPPPLTGKQLGAVYDLVEFSIQTQLTENQKRVLRDATIAEYDAGGERREGILSAPLAWAGMEMVYKDALKKQTTKEFFDKTRKDFLDNVAKSPDYPYKVALMSIAKQCDTVISAGPPPLSQQHLESFLESFEFLGAVYLGKPFTLLAADREALGTAIIAAYQELPEALRTEYANQDKAPDLLWALLRSQWTIMDRKQHEGFRRGLVTALGVPRLKDGALNEEALKKANLTKDEQLRDYFGAKYLLALPEDELSRLMRELLSQRAGLLLEQIREIPAPQPELLGRLIYDY